MKLRYEYKELPYTQNGVYWRVPSAQLEIESLEEDGWTVHAHFDKFVLLRREAKQETKIEAIDLWMPFLEARARLIKAWRREGQTCTYIAQTLSMDPGQVWLISGESPPAPDDARQSIIETRDAALRAVREGWLK